MPEALLIVDFQNDFTAGGALEVPDGHAIADRLNEMAADPRYELVVATATGTRPTTAPSTSGAGSGRCTACRDRGAELTPTSIDLGSTS